MGKYIVAALIPLAFAGLFVILAVRERKRPYFVKTYRVLLFLQERDRSYEKLHENFNFDYFLRNGGEKYVSSYIKEFNGETKTYYALREPGKAFLKRYKRKFDWSQLEILSSHWKQHPIARTILIILYAVLFIMSYIKILRLLDIIN